MSLKETSCYKSVVRFEAVRSASRVSGLAHPDNSGALRDLTRDEVRSTHCALLSEQSGRTS